jgi:multidrug efflux system membrane fusion protein
MRRSTVIALLVALAVTVWLASPHLGLDRLLGGAADGGPPAPEAAGAPPSNTQAAGPVEHLTAVRTRVSVAEPITREVVLNGRTEANRTVAVAAETSGRVVELLADEGAAVATGDVLARLDRRDREAAVAEAQAALEQRTIEYEAARRLGERGFQAETQVAAAKAALELTRYHVQRATIELGHTEIVAPFTGVLEERPVELGSFVDIGDTIARIVDLDPIVVVSDVPEARIAEIEPGGAAEVRLVDGQHHQGRVRFVARQANERTRTFRVEIEVANPGNSVPAGLSTDVMLMLDPVTAHRVSPGILVLNDAGELGIKAVAEDGTVAFHRAAIVRAEADSVWLGGLPERLEVVVVGQGFVAPGQAVEATRVDEVAARLETRATPEADTGGAEP